MIERGLTSHQKHMTRSGRIIVISELGEMCTTFIAFSFWGDFNLPGLITAVIYIA